MDNADYLKTLFTVLVTGLVAVISVNYTVDPEGIYSDFRDQGLAQKILNSEYGYILENINNRDLKLSLARHADRFDCVVIGSSHVKQLSSIRYPEMTSELCPALLNLGVNSAVIEDMFIFAQTLTALERMPDKVLLGIDPWTLNRGRDEQWKRHQDKYRNMLARLNQSEPEHEFVSYKLTLLLNLVNFAYFKNSVSSLLNPGKIMPAGQFDIYAGTSKSVVLSDGSLVYPRKRHNKTGRIQNNEIYKLDPERLHDPKVVDLLGQLVAFMRQQGAEVYLVMTPYHHEVWTENSITVDAMKAVSEILREKSVQWGVSVLGSYNPDDLGCLPGQFYDPHHPTGECVNRIFLNSRSNTTNLHQ